LTGPCCCGFRRVSLLVLFFSVSFCWWFGAIPVPALLVCATGKGQGVFQAFVPVIKTLLAPLMVHSQCVWGLGQNFMWDYAFFQRRPRQTSVCPGLQSVFGRFVGVPPVCPWSNSFNSVFFWAGVFFFTGFLVPKRYQTAQRKLTLWSARFGHIFPAEGSAGPAKTPPV